MKNRFPFRLGTTSFILRDDILPNVHYLKDKVDHVELLVFETDEQSNYPAPETLAELKAIAADHNLTYSVHLPIGIKLGSPDETRRKKDAAAVLRAIDATLGLNPLAWDMHLEKNEGQPTDTAWQDACLKSLNELKSSGADPSRIGIETLEFDYAPTVPLLDETGFSITLDIGHVWYCEYDEAFYLKHYLPRAISIHLHGFNDERDHKSLQTIPKERLQHFFDAVTAHPNAAQLPVSIEVFGEQQLISSLEAIHELT